MPETGGDATCEIDSGIDSMTVSCALQARAAPAGCGFAEDRFSYQSNDN
jgi:hypothetical protein